MWTLDSTPPVSFKHLATQPLPPPALSDSQVVGVYCRLSRERLGGQMFGRHRGGAVRSLTNIYSLIRIVVDSADTVSVWTTPTPTRCWHGHWLRRHSVHVMTTQTHVSVVKKTIDKSIKKCNLILSKFAFPQNHGLPEQVLK